MAAKKNTMEMSSLNLLNSPHEKIRGVNTNAITTPMNNPLIIMPIALAPKPLIRDVTRENTTPNAPPAIFIYSICFYFK